MWTMKNVQEFAIFGFRAKFWEQTNVPLTIDDIFFGEWSNLHALSKWRFSPLLHPGIDTDLRCNQINGQAKNRQAAERSWCPNCGLVRKFGGKLWVELEMAVDSSSAPVAFQSVQPVQRHLPSPPKDGRGRLAAHSPLLVGWSHTKFLFWVVCSLTRQSMSIQPESDKEFGQSSSSVHTQFIFTSILIFANCLCFVGTTATAGGGRLVCRRCFNLSQICI